MKVQKEGEVISEIRIRTFPSPDEFVREIEGLGFSEGLLNKPERHDGSDVRLRIN
tara:strand:+ start:30335 stop:30499 length:165 start_codon:yes stop_codon:yes gene_type:complete